MSYRFFSFSQKTNETIRLYYYSTCFRSFFGRKWKHQKVLLKLTDLYVSKDFFKNEIQYLFRICVSVSIQSSKRTYLFRYFCISRHTWSFLFKVALNSLLWTHSNKHQRVFCYIHNKSITYSKFLDRICTSPG